MPTPRLSIRPTAAPTRTIDLTHALTSAVAHELWKSCGGNEAVNWLEAERFIHTLLEGLNGTHGASDVPHAHEEGIEIERKPEHAKRGGAGRRVEGLPRLAARAMQEGDRVRGPIPLL
jgi:hypothetical protein